MLWITSKILGPEYNNRLKELRIRSPDTLTKSRIVPCHVLPLSALSTMSLSSVQTVIKFTNWIPKIMVQFCYLRLSFGIDNVSIKNRLKRRPTTRYRTYSNQIRQGWFRSDNESADEGNFWCSLWQELRARPCREDQYEIMTGASGFILVIRLRRAIMKTTGWPVINVFTLVK